MRHAHILAVTLAIAALALSVGIVLATLGSGVTPVLLGRAMLDPFSIHTNDFKIRSKNTSDVVMRKATIAVGGFSGWHTHPGPTFYTVAEGLAKVTRAPGCTEQVFGPGEGFVESGGVAHFVENVGEVPAVVYVTILNVPVGGAPADSSPPDPGC